MDSPLLLSGSLSEIPLPDVARLIQSTHKTGQLAVKSGTSIGSIYFERADIVDVQSSHLSGLDALKHLALFTRGSFEFIDNVPPPTRNLVTYPTAELIRLLEFRMHESMQISELMPSEREIPKYLGGTIPSNLEINAAELAVALKASGGTIPVWRLAQELSLDEIIVRYTVARLRAAGLMEMVGMDEQTPPAPAEPAPEEPAQPGPVPGKPKYWLGRRIE